MASPERGGRGSVRWQTRAGLVKHVLFVVSVGVGLVLMIPGTVYNDVSVERAELSAGILQIEGTALPNRTIRVDGVVMGISAADGRFVVEQWGFAAPDDCTVDVDDGWAGPAEARLSGCVVSRT
jgi:hypothetical protein